MPVCRTLAQDVHKTRQPQNPVNGRHRTVRLTPPQPTQCSHMIEITPKSKSALKKLCVHLCRRCTDVIPHVCKHFFTQEDKRHWNLHNDTQSRTETSQGGTLGSSVCPDSIFSSPAKKLSSKITIYLQFSCESYLCISFSFSMDLIQFQTQEAMWLHQCSSTRRRPVLHCFFSLPV